jgi:YD repeat-containing protein
VECHRAGLPVRVVDPVGAATRWARDGFGRIVATTDALGTTRQA